jgi:hypothetical protein
METRLVFKMLPTACLLQIPSATTGAIKERRLHRLNLKILVWIDGNLSSLGDLDVRFPRFVATVYPIRI